MMMFGLCTVAQHSGLSLNSRLTPVTAGDPCHCCNIYSIYSIYSTRLYVVEGMQLHMQPRHTRIRPREENLITQVGTLYCNILRRANILIQLLVLL